MQVKFQWCRLVRNMFKGQESLFDEISKDEVVRVEELSVLNRSALLTLLHYADVSAADHSQDCETIWRGPLAVTIAA